MWRVIIDGDIVMEGRELKNLDVEKIYSEAGKIVKNVDTFMPILLHNSSIFAFKSFSILRLIVVIIKDLHYNIIHCITLY